MMITGGAIAMPIEKQKAIVQTILEAIQQDQLPSTTFSSILDRRLLAHITLVDPVEFFDYS